MNLTNEDVADILALLDSLPYDELDLQTNRFRLILRRTRDGWTQSAEILSTSGDGAVIVDTGVSEDDGAAGDDEVAGDGVAGTGAGAGREVVAVRAPLPGTFYRAPRPGAAAFVEVGSRVGAESVVGIVETMKLMNSVHAGVAGTVTEICLGNGQFAAHGATLVRIKVDE